MYDRASDEWTIRDPRRPIRFDTPVTNDNGPYDRMTHSETDSETETVSE